jgi:ubiquitin C-terminal hydrolase
MCDNFYSDENKEKSKDTIQIIKENNEKVLDYFAMNYYSQLSKKYSEVADMFQSIVSNLNKCPNCNYVTYRFDNLFMLSLDFPELDTKIIESDIFKKMFSEKEKEVREKIDDKDLINKICMNEMRTKHNLKLHELLNFPELNDKIKESTIFKELFEEKVEKLKDKIDDKEIIAKFCMNEIKNKHFFKLSEILSFPELDDIIKNSELFKQIVTDKMIELEKNISNKETITQHCLNEIKSKNVYKLSELLDYFQRVEHLNDENLYTCPGCNEKVKAEKQIKVYKNPKYLILHIKRFNWINVNGNQFAQKINNRVDYDEIININNLMIKNSENTTYQLIGGINHLGNYQGGHYTCFAKNNNKWYDYNDDKVNEIKCEGVPNSPFAFMLIYELKSEETEEV